MEKRGGYNRKPSKHRVLEWTSKAWDRVSKETVINGCGRYLMSIDMRCGKLVSDYL
jgi:hypothetical protein